MDKDKLLEHADKLLEFILQGIEESKDFVLEQTPLLVKEIITWGIVEHLIYIIFCLIGTGVFLWIAHMLTGRINDKDYDGDKDDLRITRGVTYIAVAFLQLPVLINCLYVAKAYFAPRLYLLEYLRTLLRASGTK